jgi:hypothetical protein
MTLTSLTTSIESVFYGSESQYMQNIIVAIKHNTDDDQNRDTKTLNLYCYLINSTLTLHFYTCADRSVSNRVKISNIENIISILGTNKSDMCVYFNYGCEFLLQIANEQIIINEHSIKYNQETIDSLIKVFSNILNSMIKMQEASALKRLNNMDNIHLHSLVKYFNSKYASDEYKKLYMKIFNVDSDTAQLKKELEEAKKNQCDIHSLHETYIKQVDEMENEITKLKSANEKLQSNVSSEELEQFKKEKREEIDSVCEKYMILLKEAESKITERIDLTKTLEEEVRTELYNKLYNEVRESLSTINDEIREQQRPIIETEIRNKLHDDLYEEERDIIIEQIRHEEIENIQQEIREDLYEGFKIELYNEVQNELMTSLESAVREELKETLQDDDDFIEDAKEDVRNDFRTDESLIEEVKEEIQSNLQDDVDLFEEIRTEIKTEVYDSIKVELRESIKSDLLDHEDMVSCVKDLLKDNESFIGDFMSDLSEDKLFMASIKGKIKTDLESNEEFMSKLIKQIKTEQQAKHSESKADMLQILKQEILQQINELV